MFDWLKGDPYPTLRRVVVTTKTERTFRGVLWQRKGTYLILRSAELLKSKSEVVPLDGELLIEASNVDFVQVVT